MKYRILIVFCLPIFICGYFAPAKTTASQKVDFMYLQQLKQLKLQMADLEKACKERKSPTLLQDRFKAARLSYKKLAIILGTFNIREDKLLNAPAVDWVEEGNPYKILAPHGFQVIEELLFDKWNPVNYAKIIKETSYIKQIIVQLENETDRAFKLDDAHVFEALQKAIVRMITLGITGNDSPVALYSIAEANATLNGIEKIISVYQPILKKTDAALATKLHLSIKKAEQFTNTTASFNSFNRLSFITECVNPLYALVTQTKLKLAYHLPNGIYPTNSNTESIFDGNFFNTRFFSPNENHLPTPERIYLGKLLFNDPILSGNGTRSCASCHQPEKAFTDGLSTALAYDGVTFLRRNTPTLTYAALQTSLFADSRASVLENQLNEVIHDSQEMHGSLKASVLLLDSISEYKKLFSAAFPSQKKAVTQFNITNAISSYLRSLAPFNSRFDEYMGGNKNSLSASEKLGFNVFMGKGKCGTCHFMPLFNGLVPPNFSDTESEVLGVPKIATKTNAILDDDEGKMEFSKSTVHRFAFKTPTLRNISKTAPYMHNGVFKTLNEVVEFYNEGGGQGLNIAPANQTLPFDKLNLSKKEMQALVNFMQSLDDAPSK
jgi:cytochrome c peroxidase